MILSTEHKLARPIDFQHVIDDFAAEKAIKKVFRKK